MLDRAYDGGLAGLANPGDTVVRAHVAVPVGFVARTADGSEIGTPPWAR